MTPRKVLYLRVPPQVKTDIERLAEILGTTQARLAERLLLAGLEAYTPPHARQRDGNRGGT